MYNEQSIQTLVKRIGWQQPIQPSEIVLSAENVESTSGRYFSGFNPLVIVENVFSAIQNVNVSNETLITKLEELKYDGVMDVLNHVFNLNVRATAAVTNLITSVNYATDYSDMINTYQSSFDEVIGYSVAIKTLQLLLNSDRSNYRTVHNQENKADIFEVINGAFSPYGQRITKGIDARYREAIYRLIDVLFPVTYPEGSEIITDSNGGIKVVIKEKPVLRGIQPW